MNDEETKEIDKKLADEHWEWMQKFVGEWACIWLKLVEECYKDGFIHGFKHGQKEAKK